MSKDGSGFPLVTTDNTLDIDPWDPRVVEVLARYPILQGATTDHVLCDLMRIIEELTARVEELERYLPCPPDTEDDF